MIELIEKYKAEIEAFDIKNAEDLEKFRLTYLSKKGLISDLFASFKTVPVELKKQTGEKPAAPPYRRHHGRQWPLGQKPGP